MMKLRVLILYLFCLFCMLLNATTLHIKQDGTGNFAEIQEGIIAAADNDTVLVYPGTYFECIDYLEKSITVASLYIITLEDSLINQTIIDGNNEFRCVTIDECVNTQLIGFTIQNGLAIQDNVYESYEGGGIFIKEISNSLIANCIVKNNKSINGGGIWIYSGNVTLRGNTIKNNRSIQTGGGLNIIGDTNVQFDEIDLNSIFLNYSSTGTDIFLSQYLPNTINVIVDTFSVNEHDYFFVAAKGETYTFSNLNYKIEQIDQDLFVAPNGNDENDGLTVENPLQTIAWAQTIIQRNDENPHTIHLASGIYSPSINNQQFPFGVKHGVKYIGISPEETILDGDNQYNVLEYHFYPDVELPKIYLENIKIINDLHDSYGAIFTLKANIELNNVIISNCYGDVGSAIKCRDGIYDFKNVEIINNSGGEAIRISCIYAENPNPIMDINLENILIQDNCPGQTAGSGGGSNLRGHLNILGDYKARILNCNFNGNYSNFYNPQTGLGGSSAMLIGDQIEVDAINSTFGSNILSHVTGCVITTNNSEINMFNCILYANDGYSFNIWGGAEINISHSLIEGGDENVNYYGNGYVNWLEDNLDEDPLWMEDGEFPYYLQSTSPCIDTGTLDLPAGIELPEYDLAGNPRIYGASVDMGAYEWQGVETVEEEIPAINKTRISNYPNPFNPSTTFKLELVEAGKIELAIYNIKGQKVKTLMDAYTVRGTFEVNWKGKDEMGNSVSSGQYVVKLHQNGKETAKKIMMLK